MRRSVIAFFLSLSDGDDTASVWDEFNRMAHDISLPFAAVYAQLEQQILEQRSS